MILMSRTSSLWLMRNCSAVSATYNVKAYSIPKCLFYLFVPPFGLRLEATWLAIGREHFSLVCNALKEALYKCIDTIQPKWLRERSFATGTSCLSALGQSLLFRLIGSTRS